MTTLLHQEKANKTIDAGLFAKQRLGINVWRDSDADGNSRSNRIWHQWCYSILKDATGTTVATRVTGVNPTTGAAGYYTFSVDPEHMQ
ncbi:MAG: hypothetical protein IPH96_17635 [Saprospiraceae bacterium]|nr:hypothetical protein [Saprospiraceae bacterium]